MTLSDALKPKLSPRACAEILGVSTDFILGEIRDGVLTARVRTRDSGRVIYRIEQEDFDEYVRSWRAAGASRPSLRPVVAGVYFIRCGEFVKIGCTTNLAKRMSTLATSVPFELELLAIQPLGPSASLFALEAAFHQQFASLHVRGEWFLLKGALAAFIHSIRLESAK